MTVRRTASLFANYTLLEGSAEPATATGAFARRTVVEADGQRVVELLPLQNPPPDLAELGLPIVTVTSMSLLTDRATAGWTRGDCLTRSVLLVDIPIGPSLAVWLDRLDSSFRFVFLRTESFNTVVPFLVGLIEVDQAPALPLPLRPLSHARVRIHKAALAELNLGRVREDGAFLDAYADLLERCLAHLTGEEVRFGAPD